ncbi:guanylate kinase [Afifella sp. IM 167]|uniref:guanylate kinase n=1 Tax=Afifella sp. IM 167 TaxID=2033586 RepID=UPI001CCB3C9D|nr:guanylate kinase [Afifella sp. IM 167]MBZ8131728.1 guanylate kinase [Afifella sp. IM 167]
MTTEPIRLMRRGLMFVLSSPSGAGKSTLARQLLDADDGLELSISVTTRARRQSERDGVHYHFIDEPHFTRMVERGDLLEWAQVHGHHYGTPLEPVEDALSAGRDVLFDIDWQGTAQIAEKLPNDIVRVFVLPPTMRELKARLVRRAEDSRETIGRRLTGSIEEIEQWSRYDYIIVNDDLECAFSAVRGILTAERLKRDRVTGLRAFVSQLLTEGRELIDELQDEAGERTSST